MTISHPRLPLPVLTSLRFFAAAEVVVNHAVTPMLTPGPLRDLGAGGYEAVTFFFVLSGFILTYVYNGAGERDHLNVARGVFWRARAARILPAYYLGLVLAAPFFVYGIFVSRNVDAPVADFMLVPVLMQAWWPPAALAWNAPAWSLSCEVFFYLCFPWLAAAFAGIPRHRFLLLAGALVVAVAVLRILIARPGETNTFASNFEAYFPLLHLPQFILGMALGRTFLFGRNLAPAAHALMFGAGFIGLVLLFGARSLLPFWAMNSAMLALLFGLVVFGGARPQALPGFLSSRPLTLLGEASYAIYILHLPLQIWWNWLTRGWGTAPAVGVTIYLALLIGISILVFWYVETPLRRWITGHRPHRAA